MKRYMHYVYAIKSRPNGKIYIGQTKGMEGMIVVHNKGRVKSTKNHIPRELVAIQNGDSRDKSKWIERPLKNSHGIRLIFLNKNGL